MPMQLVTTQMEDSFDAFRAKNVHCTGIKGTGVAAIAEILVDEGARVTGSDVVDVFFTDELLARIGVVPRVGFAAAHVPEDTDVLIYSAAYGPENPERRAAEERGIPQVSYAEALGLLSRGRLSLGVSGVHGKTSTTAMIGTLVSGSTIPVTVIAGSAVPSFGGSATLRHGRELFVAETCEYRRHFLSFHPTVVLLTGVESDHQDYYRDENDILSAFREFVRRIAPGGALIYCADDPGATDTARAIGVERSDVALIPYGFTADGRWRCTHRDTGAGRQRFTIAETGDAPWAISVPGRHMIANATGAVAALTAMLARHPGSRDSERSLEHWRTQLADFRGTRRRSEVVAEIDGITIIDDYAHHPTAIRSTLAGYREFYPGRRLIVDFMSHTYSRTAALLDQFGRAFSDADLVILNEIYASAREQNHTGTTGESLFRVVAEHHRAVVFEPDFRAAADRILEEVRVGDVVITMGAGDNFHVGREVARRLSSTGGGVAHA